MRPRATSFIIDTSFISPGKPIKKDMLSSKKAIKHLHLPTISTAFWESILYHYLGSRVSGIIYDMIPGKFHSYLEFTFIRTSNFLNCLCSFKNGLLCWSMSNNWK